jgi:hypothetical protein
MYSNQLNYQTNSAIVLFPSCFPIAFAKLPPFSLPTKFF